jgi:uncharacterized LabA/DUF88 family protein
MISSSDNISMALFCDFENLALGVRDAKYEKFDIRPVLERLLLKGSIVVKKAYCDWERYKGFKSIMHEANFELIEIPHVRQSGKNSADIRLVVDALDLCYTKSHVNTFVIISGDSDFSPLVSKLRENAKHVIGVGVQGSTSDLLVANCDEFIFYDDLMREVQRNNAAKTEVRDTQQGAARAADEDRRRRDPLEVRRSKAVAMAVETFDALVSERGDSGKIWASVLKEAIKRRRPDFSEAHYGFRAFGNLLEEAQARGLLELGRDEKSGTFVHRSTNVVAAQRSEDEAAAPVEAAPDSAPADSGGKPEPRRKGRGSRKGTARKAEAPRAHVSATPAIDPRTGMYPDEDEHEHLRAGVAQDVDAASPPPLETDTHPSSGSDAPPASETDPQPASRADASGWPERPAARERTGRRRGARNGGRERRAASAVRPSAAAPETPRTFDIFDAPFTPDASPGADPFDPAYTSDGPDPFVPSGSSDLPAASGESGVDRAPETALASDAADDVAPPDVADAPPPSDKPARARRSRSSRRSAAVPSGEQVQPSMFPAASAVPDALDAPARPDSTDHAPGSGGLDALAPADATDHAADPGEPGPPEHSDTTPARKARKTPAVGKTARKSPARAGRLRAAAAGTGGSDEGSEGP